MEKIVWLIALITWKGEHNGDKQGYSKPTSLVSSLPYLVMKFPLSDNTANHQAIDVNSIDAVHIWAEKCLSHISYCAPAQLKSVRLSFHTSVHQTRVKYICHFSNVIPTWRCPKLSEQSSVSQYSLLTPSDIKSRCIFECVYCTNHYTMSLQLTDEANLSTYTANIHIHSLGNFRPTKTCCPM